MASDSNGKDTNEFDLHCTLNSDYHDIVLSRLTNRHQYSSAPTTFLSVVTKIAVLSLLNIIHSLQTTIPKTFFNTTKNQNISISSHISLWNWRKTWLQQKSTLLNTEHTIIAIFYVIKTVRFSIKMEEEGCQKKGDSVKLEKKGYSVKRDGNTWYFYQLEYKAYTALL